MKMDVLDRIPSFNPITFLKSMVSLNRSANGGMTQEYVQYSSTKYPNGQVVRDVNTVSIKTIMPPSKVGNTVDVRI